MLLPRIIPCLLIKDKGLVKTVGFSDPKYVGDPINAVKIFNEKGADELIVLDIDATLHGHEPDYRMIENFAAESRMPLCYGGGIKTAEQAKTIIGLGIEKVAMSSGAINNPKRVTEVAEAIGNQSVVVVLDVKKQHNGKYEVWTHNGRVNSHHSLKEAILKLEHLGVGEIVINSINNDGQMKGYDLEMVEQIMGIINVPLTVLGGAGTLKDMGQLIKRFGVIGAAAGSMFVFKGIYKAVLINYPNTIEKDELFHACLNNVISYD